MQGHIKIAAVQMVPQLMQIRDNLREIEYFCREAAIDGVDLLIFPECCLTGYVFNSRQEALPYGETIPGPAVEKN